MSCSRLYIFAAALLLAACDETTRVPSQDRAFDQPTLADADLPDLARAISKALAAPAARQDILAAMRASRAVEHRLLLADYLKSPEGARLLAGSAQAFAATSDEFLERVDRIRQIAELAIAVPMRDHRLNWRGGADIGVAGA